MIKVLLASPKLGARGGIARWTGHIMDYYQSLNNPTIQLSHFDTARKVAPNASNMLLRLCRGLTDYPQMLRHLRANLIHNRYDIIHFTSSASWGLIRDLLIIKYAHSTNTKAVVHFRFGRIPQLSISRNWEWYLLRRVIKKADSAIVIDRASYDTLKKEINDDLFLLPNPLTPRIRGIVEEYKDDQVLNNTVLFVGHCYREKGVFELMEACRQISGVRLKFIGSIAEQVKQALIRISGNSIIYSIEGEKPYEEIIKEMINCMVFVLPSYTEGFPNVILEAMACGCAIVATNVGAIPEMLERDDNGNYGVMVEPQNVDELRDAIVKIITDGEFREECQRNVKRRVNERYTMPSVWTQMINIWNRTLSFYVE